MIIRGKKKRQPEDRVKEGVKKLEEGREKETRK